jgi:hypothetical protein
MGRLSEELIRMGNESVPAERSGGATNRNGRRIAMRTAGKVSR